MKIKLIFGLLIFSILIPSFAQAKKRNYKQEVDSLETALMETRDELFNTRTAFYNLQGEINDLRRKNRQLQDQLEDAVSFKKMSNPGRLSVIRVNDNEENDELIDDYRATFVEIASNFLYVPYDEYSIYEVAIPAFEKAKGSTYYDDYAIRLKMLQHYKEDISYIIKFLNKALNDMPQNGSLTKWAQDSKAEFGKYAVVKGYQQYGDDWQDTYLGKYIMAIFNQLNNISGNDAAERIRTNLTRYKDELSAMLNPQ